MSLVAIRLRLLTAPRQRSATPTIPASRDLLGLALASSLVTWLLFILISVVAPLPAAPPQTAVTMLSLIAAVLAGAASVMCLVRARLTGERAALLAGLALLIYGLMRVGLGDVVIPRAGSGQVGLGAVAALAWFVAFCLLLAAVAVDSGGVRSVQAGLGLVVAAAVVGTVAVVGPGVGADLVRTGARGGSLNWVPANLVSAAAWTGAGVAALVGGLRAGRTLRIWVGVTLLAFAQSRMAFLMAPRDGVWALAAELFRGEGMLIVVLGTARATYQAFFEQKLHLDESVIAVEGAEARRREEKHRQDEVVHDLLAALSSVGAAARLLAGPGETEIAGPDRDGLAEAVEAELERVRCLLGRSRRAVAQPFCLLDVLMPLVVCARARGTRIGLDVPPGLEVLGDGSAVAEIVQVLIDNARCHAPGSPVEVTARGAGPTVVVLVEDRGPGFENGTAELIFERGWTTDSTGTGSGLGLFVAARLAREQGGTIRARQRVGGGASFVVELPAVQRNEWSGEHVLVTAH